MNTQDLSAILSVREITAYIKRLFDRDEVLQDVVIRGEVSNFTRHRSGHWYFTLKDEDAALDCVCFRNVARTIGFEMEDGMQVVAGGRISVYEKQGRYQLIVFFLRPDGVGALHAAFERLRAKLQGEGLFDEAHKRPLPRYPSCIALVTSPTGAAVRDLTSIISRRFPLARMVLVPALVQGEAAPRSLIEGLARANSLSEVDLIIIGRGGGSLEDLWAFNDENLARAIFNSRKPVISAVGHETDVTIADLVADVRAATPSAAAELAVPDKGELLVHLDNLASRAISALRSRLRRAETRLERVAARPPLRAPRSLIEEYLLRTDTAWDRAVGAMVRACERGRHNLGLLDARLQAQRPVALLKRWRERLTALGERVRVALVRLEERAQARLALLQVRLAAQHPRRRLALRRELSTALAGRAHRAARHCIERQRGRLEALAGRAEALNPRAVLNRGYSVTLRLPEESVVYSAPQVHPGDSLRILLAHGELRATTAEVKKAPAEGPVGGDEELE